MRHDIQQPRIVQMTMNPHQELANYPLLAVDEAGNTLLGRFDPAPQHNDWRIVWRYIQSDIEE